MYPSLCLFFFSLKVPVVPTNPEAANPTPRVFDLNRKRLTDDDNCWSEAFFIRVVDAGDWSDRLVAFFSETTLDRGAVVVLVASDLSDEVKAVGLRILRLDFSTIFKRKIHYNLVFQFSLLFAVFQMFDCFKQNTIHFFMCLIKLIEYIKHSIFL